MGLLGAVLGIGAAVVTGISKATAFIGGVVTKVGAAVSGFARKSLEVVAKIPQIDMKGVGRAIDAVGNVAHAVTNCLGIKSEEGPEVLGAKAEQAGRGIKDFDNDAEAYIKYLNKEIELDKEKFDRLSEEEKLGCKAVGTALEVKAIEEKIGGIEIAPEMIALLAKIQLADEGIEFSAEELVGLIRDLKAAGITNLKDVVDMLEGEKKKSGLKTEIALEKALGNINRVDDPVEELDKIEKAVRSFDSEEQE